MTDARKEWLRAIPLFATCMVGTALPLASIYSLGQFMAPLEEAFGWSRTQVSSGITVGFVVGFILAPFVGRLIDRASLRAIAIPGVALNALSLAAFSLADGNSALWIGLWLFNSVTVAVVGPTLWLAAAGAAVSSNKNLALGLSLCGTGLAAAIAPPLARALLDAYPWQTAYQLMALSCGLVSLVLTVFFLRDHRTHRGAAAAADAAPSASMRELFFTASFIKLAVVVFASMVAISSFMIHLSPALVDSGLSKDRAASLAAMAGLSAIAGKLCVGWLFDRYSLRLVSVGVMAALGVASTILAVAAGQEALALIGALALGFSGGAMLTVMACVSAKQFDARDFGVVYGALASATGVGSSVGPLGFSFIHDQTGSYVPGFWAGLGIAIASALVLSTLGGDKKAAVVPHVSAEPAE